MMGLLFGNARAGRIGDVTLISIVIIQIMGVWTLYSLYALGMIIQTVLYELMDYRLEQKTITRMQLYIFATGMVVVSLVQLISIFNWDSTDWWLNGGTFFFVGVFIALAIRAIRQASKLKTI